MYKLIFMEQPVLTKQIYRFTKGFTPLLENDDKSGRSVVLHIDLHIDMVNNAFYLDLSDAFDIQRGVITFAGVNCMGNTDVNTKPVGLLFLWMAEIVHLVDTIFKKNHSEGKPIMFKQEVKDIAIAFAQMIEQRHDDDDEVPWHPYNVAVLDRIYDEDLYKYLNPKPSKPQSKATPPLKAMKKHNGYEKEENDDEDDSPA